MNAIPPWAIKLNFASQHTKENKKRKKINKIVQLCIPARQEVVGHLNTQVLLS